MNNQFPIITQYGRDGNEEIGYIANMKDSATAGFKYIECTGIKAIKFKARGYATGFFEVKTTWNGPVLGTIPIQFSNSWQDYVADIDVPDGIQAIYFAYRGEGITHFGSFTLIS